jgi:hypothetical protein
MTMRSTYFLPARASSSNACRLGLGDLGAGAFQGLLKALAIEGLEQIIQGVDLEGAQSILVIRRDENDTGRPVLAHGLQDAEAVQFGHAYIEKQEIGPLLTDGRDGARTVEAFADHLNVGFGLKQRTQALPAQRLVIRDQDT